MVASAAMKALVPPLWLKMPVAFLPPIVSVPPMSTPPARL